MMSESTQEHDGRGFTLIETLVVVGLIGFIAAALAVTITVFLRTEGSVTTRLTDSRDLQNMTNFLPGDVASSRLLESEVAGENLDPATVPCGSGGEVLLHAEWNEFWTTSYSARVTYRVFPNYAAPETVERFLCQSGNPETSIVVARAFDGLSIELQRDPSPGNPLTGTVDVRFTYDGGEFKRITGTSRHFLP